MKAVSKGEEALNLLHGIRDNSGKMDTVGLSDANIMRFCKLDSNLFDAIHEASMMHNDLTNRLGTHIMHQDEPVSYTHLTLPTIYSV